ncbi:Aldehyde dehydrogenase, dimeric NADP-preferring [Leucoagaricus sp. SymC.cos]|nr:Aldehyde dehydrogenase, dimeric NADP-preferring [Leucoagaricus sp. SymC.cos]
MIDNHTPTPTPSNLPIRARVYKYGLGNVRSYQHLAPLPPKMTTPAYIPLERFPEIRAELKSTFASGRTKVIPWRQRQLLQLARLVQENADAIAEAVHKDLGKPRFEIYLAETGPVVERSIICAKKVAEWAKDEDKSGEVDDWMKGWKPTVRKEPKGVALIIAPWNYPVILSLQPLYGAIAAGCCAVIKPSEIAPSYSRLLAELVPKYLDNDAFRVVEGAVPEITRLLELQWDHIFYTGNGRVARVISAAAARHLTPLTLELGGKNPVIIDPAADVDLAAKRIIYGKSQNAGQICVSPDYVLCPKSVLDQFVKLLNDHAKSFWPESTLKSSSFGRIVSNAHFSRLTSILQSTRAKVISGGGRDFEGKIDPAGRPRGLELTIFLLEREHWDDDALMSEWVNARISAGPALTRSRELFGPFLPILPVEDINEAIGFVSARDHPLVLYAFCSSDKNKDKILHNTMSGNAVFNDTFQQLAVNELPFGGVGESGYGRQVLRYSFDIFTYERTVIDIPNEMDQALGIRYPPYTQDKFDILSGPTKMPIPKLEDL